MFNYPAPKSKSVSQDQVNWLHSGSALFFLNFHACKLCIHASGAAVLSCNLGNFWTSWVRLTQWSQQERQSASKQSNPFANCWLKMLRSFRLHHDWVLAKRVWMHWPSLDLLNWISANSLEVSLRHFMLAEMPNSTGRSGHCWLS